MREDRNRVLTVKTIRGPRGKELEAEDLAVGS
jgi:hypothetical protein